MCGIRTAEGGWIGREALAVVPVARLVAMAAGTADAGAGADAAAGPGAGGAPSAREADDGGRVALLVAHDARAEAGGLEE